MTSDSIVIAGTGHRPPKVDCSTPDNRLKLVTLAEDFLSKYIDRIKLVISGGALGWDQALAAAAFNLDIPYSMYLPFKGFDSKWAEQDRISLYGLCEDSNGVLYCSEPPYAVWKMHKRNECMVNDADLILALWDGSTGGTYSCIQYATKRNKTIVNLWGKFKNEEEKNS